MLAVTQGDLRGKVIHRYLPSLTNVPMHDASEQHLRTVMQARGQRDDGETFLADICFSTYHTNAGFRVAAMVLDASEEFRTHEVSGLHQLLAGSRIAIGAISDEIRNVSCPLVLFIRISLIADYLLGTRILKRLVTLLSPLNESPASICDSLVIKR